MANSDLSLIFCEHRDNGMSWHFLLAPPEPLNTTIELFTLYWCTKKEEWDVSKTKPQWQEIKSDCKFHGPPLAP